MTDYQRIYFQGALINSALYLAIVAAAGIVGGHKAVVIFAALSAGLAFLSYCGQLRWPGSVVVPLVSVISNLYGALAGVTLLVEYLK
jgi:hypothetical protein